MLAICTGCEEFMHRSAERHEFQNLKVDSREVASGRVLSVEGLLAHSGLAIEDVCINRDGDTIWLRVTIVPTRKGLTGRMEERLFVPIGVTQVVLGQKRHAIWTLRQE